ncbi:MAG TPA: potassium transporter TrkG, partial [Opitutales bacterium]|nr:potassium transporter TrkG [Opitutales bacterium]
IHESSGRTADFEQGHVRKGVMQLFFLYLGISVAGFIAFKLCGMSWFDAVCHMYATVSTGGFSTRSASLSAFESPAIEWTTIFFMLLGATNFFFLLHLVRGQWKQARKFTEVFAYFLIAAGSILLFLVYVHIHSGGGNALQSLRAAAFQVVSISSTTGFATADFNQWPLFTKMGLLALMVIGGCSASTAGGMKVVRLIVSMRVSVQAVERSFRAHVVRPVMMNGQPLDEAARDNILSYLVLLALVFWISLPLFGLMESRHSLEGAVSAVVATLFNVGPGFSEFGPTENYVALRAPTKIYLSFLMILGRVELFAILALLVPSLWKKFS